MTRFKASFVATDMGLAECTITEVGRDGSEEKVHSFLVELSAPDAKGALIGALRSAVDHLDVMDRGMLDDRARDGYLVKLRNDGAMVECHTRYTSLSESGELVECDFDDFVVKGIEGDSTKDAMTTALLSVKDRLDGLRNPNIVD